MVYLLEGRCLMNGEKHMNAFETVKQRVDKISDNRSMTAEYMPVSAKVEICGRCTLSCKFCFQNEMRMKSIRQKMMTSDDFDHALDFIKSVKSIREVGLFYMGESALNSSMPMFYKKAKDAGYFTYLTTNGTIRDTVIDSIPYVDSLKVSWNYSSVDDFIDKTRAPSSVFFDIKHNIELFFDECHRHRKRLTVSTVLDGNSDEYDNELRSLKFDDHYFLPLQTQCGTISRGIGGVVGQYDCMRSQVPCWSLFKGLYIDCDLNVRTCCYGHHDCHVLYNIHDVQSYHLDQKLITMRQAQLENKIPEECRGCTDCI